MTDSEHKYLEKLRAHAAGTRKLWSNVRKPERERMTVRAFLRCIGVPFKECELQSCENDPPDVIFRGARFEVTEDIGGRKRGDVWRKLEERWMKANGISDVVEPYSPSQPMPMAEGWRKAVDALGRKAKKYGPGLCAQLDGLVYLDLVGRHLWPLENILDSEIASALREQGWRAVSILFPPYGAVLCAGQDAPDFLREVAGNILNEWPRPGADGLFDAELSDRTR